MICIESFYPYVVNGVKYKFISEKLILFYRKMQCEGCGSDSDDAFCKPCLIIIEKGKPSQEDLDNYGDNSFVTKNHIDMMKVILNWCDSFEKNREIYKKEINDILLINYFPSDCIKIILSCTNDGSTYKNLLLTCRYFYMFLEINGDKWKKRFSNHLRTLLKFWPNSEWDWESISENINISWEFIQENQHLPWDWECVPSNPNVSLDIIMSDKRIKEKFYGLSGNRNLTIDIVLLHPSAEWDWASITENPAMTMEIIEKHPELPWDNWRISFNPNITWDFMQKYPEYEWGSSGRQIGVTLDVVLKNSWSRWKWSWIAISENSNITWKTVQENPHIKWDSYGLAMNPNITLDIILNNMDIFGKWENIGNPGISHNPNLTWQDIITHRDKDIWYIGGLSMNDYGKKFIKK